MEGSIKQEPKAPPAPAGPIPAQIAEAKRVLISNLGQDNFDDGPVVLFSGSSDRVYDQLYAEMKQWGRY